MVEPESSVLGKKQCVRHGARLKMIRSHPSLGVRGRRRKDLLRPTVGDLLNHSWPEKLPTKYAQSPLQLKSILPMD